MVAIISGNGLGLFNTSLGTLGANGSFGNAGTGRSGETVYVNAATGNLVLQRQDELLVSQGQDVGVVRTYNSLGKRTDDNGDNWQLGVHKRLFGLTGPINTADSKITRTDGDGVELVYTYDAASGRYFNRDGGGARDALVYNSTTSKWTWTDGDTLVQETYDWNGSAGRILTEGEFGSTVLSTYNYTGALLTSIKDGSGETVFFDYTGNNLMKVRTVKTDGTVTRVQYNYDNKNRLISVTVDLTPADNNIADGKVYKTTYTYDGDSARVASMTQTDGTTVAFDYEAQSDGSTRIKRVRQTMDDGSVRTTTFTYDLAQRQTTVSDALGNATVYTYDAAGQLLNVKGPAVGDGLADNGLTFTYDAGGNLEKVINSRGAPIAYASLTYAYDAAGNRINEQDQAFNPILGRTYSASNRLLSETTSIVSQSSGLTTQVQAKTYYVYDASDRLAFRIAPEGLVTEYRYTGQSREASSIITYAGASFDLLTIPASTQPTLAQLTTWSTNASLDKTRNLRTDIVRDFRGQISTSTAYTKLDTTGKGVADGSESTTLYVYDQAGQLLKTVTPRGTATTATNDFERTFTYDGLGRLLVQTDTLGQVTSNEYDDAGRSVTTKMANGLVTTSVYDKAGELVSVTKSANGTLFGTTLHQYDAAGNLRMTQDPIGNRYFFLYDAKGRKTAEIDANGSIVEFRYTEDGHLIQSTRYATALTPAQMAKLLDANGKVTNVGVAALGLVKSPDDRSVYHTYRGDINVVTGKRLLDQTIDELGYVTQHRYDTAGRLLAQTRLATQFTGTPPANGNSVNVKNDAAKDRATRYFYDNEGRLTGTLDAEGYLVERKYDVAGRLALTIAYTKVSASAKWASGTLAELRTSTGTDGVRTRYFYDNQNRLAAEVDGLGYLTKYAYDRDGNRVQQSRYVNKIKLDVTTLTEKTKLEEILFDTHADDQVTSWTYTDAGQVATQTNPEGTIKSYTYDKVGNLTKTETAYNTLDVRAHQVRYDELGRVMGELGGEGSAELIKLAASVAPAVPTKAQIDAVWAKYGTSHAYDAAGRKVRTTDANGHSTYFYYDADNRLKYTINPLGEVVEHSYTIFGENDGKTAYATPLSATIKAGLTGGAASAISAAVTALINAAVDGKTSATFSKRGEVLTRTDELLNKQTMTYNAFGDLATLKSPVDAARELLTTYEVDRRGLRTKTIEDAAGINRITSAVYDAFGRMTSSVDGNLVTSTIAYDARGRVTTTTGPLRGAGGMTYDAFDRVLTQKDANGNDTVFTYNTLARSVTIKTPAGITTVTTRNAHGETVEVEDALNNKTVYEYDKDGNLKTTTDALTQTQKKVYDGANRLIETYDANNVKTVYTYDTANKLLTVTVDPTGVKRTTSYVYNSKDRTVDVTDANGVVTRTVYDRKGQVKDVIVDPTGLALKTSYTYDPQGRTQTVTEGVGTAKQSKTQYNFDMLGRRSSQVVDVGGLNLKTSYTYDKEGNVVSRIEGVGTLETRTTWFTYDSDRRLVFTIDALGNISRVFYDKAGRVTQTIAYATAITPQTTAPTTAAIETLMTSKASVKDRITRHAYDKDGRERFTIDPMGAVVEHQYNEVGNRVTSIAYANPLQGTLAPGAMPTVIAAGAAAPAAPAPYVRQHADDRTTTYGYDALSRRTTLRVTANGKDALKESWKHDKAGNVVSHTDGRGYVEWFSYDAANRVKRHIDAKGYVTERFYEPDSAKVTEKTWMNPIAVPADPDPSWAKTAPLPNPDTSIKSGDRTTITEYDKAGRLDKVTAANGVVTDYTYDAVGNLTDITTAFGTALAVTEHRDYDKAGRLDLVTDANQVVTDYQYDAFGNLTDTVEASNIAALKTTLHRQYDKIGRLTHETRAYGTQDATTTFYDYDALGDRTLIVAAHGTPVARTTVQKFDLAGRKTHVFDVLKIREGETETTQEAVTATTYNAFGDIATVTDPLGKIGYFYTDALGRVTLQVDPLGAVTETLYNATGQVEETVRYAGALVGALDAKVRPKVLDSAANATAGVPYVVRKPEADQRQKVIVDELGRKKEIQTWYGTNATDFYRETFTYDAVGNVKTATARNGATTQYEYDKVNNKIREVLPVSYTVAGRVVPLENQYDYDERGNLKTRIEAFGLPEQRTTSYGYDKLNRLETETGEAMTTFDAATSLTKTETPVKRRYYDKLGRLIEEKDASGGRTLHYYDAQGRETGRVDAGGGYTAFVYDAAGNKKSETVYANSVAMKPSGTQFPNDQRPAVLATAPASGFYVLTDSARDRKVEYEYDDMGRQTKTIVRDVVHGKYELALAAGGEPVQIDIGTVETSNQYDLAGNLIKLVDGNGNVTRRYYDNAGNLVGQLDAGGYLTTWTRDKFGNVGLQAQYANKILGVVGDTTTLAELVSASRLVLDETRDRLTDYKYDLLNRVKSESRLKVVYGQVNSTTGALTEKTGDATTLYAYDGFSNVTKQTDANGGVTDTEFDEIGRKIRHKGVEFKDHQNRLVRSLTEYEYNGLNLVRREIVRGMDNLTEADDRITEKVYGVNGYQTEQISSGTPSAKYEFKTDVAGRVTKRTLVGQKDANGTALTNITYFAYDAAGREVWHKDDATGTTEETRYNVFGEITGKRTNGAASGDQWSQIADYDKMGNAWRTNIGDGIVKIYVFDKNGNATFEITNPTADLRNFSQIDAVTLLKDNNQTASVYDERNHLVDTIQPSMSDTRSIVGISQALAQQQSNAYPGGTTAPGGTQGSSSAGQTNTAAIGGIGIDSVRTITTNITSRYSTRPDGGRPGYSYLSAEHVFSISMPQTSFGSGALRIRVQTPGTGVMRGLDKTAVYEYGSPVSFTVFEDFGLASETSYQSPLVPYQRPMTITIEQRAADGTFQPVATSNGTVTTGRAYYQHHGPFQSTLSASIGSDTAYVTGQGPYAAAMYLRTRPLGSADGWQVTEIKPNQYGDFSFHSSLLRGQEYRYMVLDQWGKVINFQRGEVTADGQVVNREALSMAAAGRTGSAGDAFMTSGNQIHLTQLGEGVQYGTQVWVRKAGTAGAWTQVPANLRQSSHGPDYTSGWVTFDANPYAPWGQVEYLVVRSDNSGEKISTGTFTPAVANSFSELKFYQRPSAVFTFGSQPGTAATMTLRFQAAGQPEQSVTLSRTPEGTFVWEAGKVFSSLNENRVYDFRYETKDSAGIVVNKASGQVQLGIEPKELSHVAEVTPTRVSFPVPKANAAAAGATKLILQYRLAGSASQFEKATLTEKIGTAFLWDASAVIKPGTTGAIEYSFTLENATGTIKSASGRDITVGGTLNVGAASGSTMSLNIVTLGTVKVDGLVHRIQEINAFGEVVAEADVDRKVTDPAEREQVKTKLSYNTLGKLIRKEEAEDLVTLANGFQKLVRPTTNYYYDLLGRLVATDDANKNRTTQVLLGDTERVVKQFNAEIGGIKENGYDIFGDTRFTEDEIDRRTEYSYDLAGRLLRIDRPKHAGTSIRAYDEYGYDAAGNRISHKTTTDGTKVLSDYTFFDSLGRITQTVTPMGFTTAYRYEWVGTVNTVGDLPPGGWRKTTTDATGRTIIDEIDTFNRTTKHTDLGGRVFTYVFNNAGWLKSQTSVEANGASGQDIKYDHYASGYIKSILDDVSDMLTTYAYDDRGNRIYETYSRTLNGQPEYFQNASITYDRNSRVTRIQDFRADIRYEYDAVGNRRRVWSYYHDGVDGKPQVQDYWYAYDEMNRFTVTMGQLSSNNNTRATSENDTSIKVVAGQPGTIGIKVSYNLAGERKTIVKNGGGLREDYAYNEEGYLTYTYTSADPSVKGRLQTTRTNDLLGRVTNYQEFDAYGSSSLTRTTQYDDDSRQLQQTGTDGTTKFHYYGKKKADGTDDVTKATPNGPGALAWVQTVNGDVTIDTWTSYEYWDQAKQKNITNKGFSANAAIDNNAWKSGLSKFEYDKNGHLMRAEDVVGKTTFAYISNAQGMIMRRERSYAGVLQDAHFYIYANNASVGEIGNDGDVQRDYAQQIGTPRIRREEMYKSWVPIASADFDQNYQPINRDYPGPTSENYVARTGDTLYTIAASLWGDSSMWYLIADANGLAADADLTAGQVIRIPNKVTNIHNNNTTMRPYNAGERIGDTSPTLPDAPSAPIPAPKQSGGKKCGGLAKILVAVVAVVATIYTAGAAAYAFSAVAPTAGATFASTMAAGVSVLGGAGGAMGLAAAAVGGAVGNAAGQLTGMGLGIQDKFNWGSVATSALTSMAGSGLARLNVGSSFATAVKATEATAGYIGAAANAVAGNMVTQGIGMLTGQQKSFSWSSVAASAIAAPMTNYVQDGLFGKSGTFAGTWAAGSGFAGKLAQSTVSSFVSAATRLVVVGGRMSWQDVAGDAIGNAVSNSIVEYAQKQAQKEKARGVTSAALHSYSKRGTDVVRDQLMQSDPTMSLEQATAIANRPKVQSAVQIFAAMGNAQDATGMAFEDMPLQNQRDYLAQALQANGDSLLTDEMSAKPSVSPEIQRVEVHGRGNGFNSFVKTGADVLDVTQNAMADLIETIGPKKAEAAAFGFQLAVGGIPRTALSYLGEETIGPAKEYLTGKLSGVIAQRAFGINDANPAEAEAITKVSNALSGFGIEAALGTAGSLVTGVVAYKYLRASKTSAPNYETPDDLLPDNIRGNGNIGFRVKKPRPAFFDKLTRPVDRHYFDKVNANVVPKDDNTLIHPRLRDAVADDLAKIRGKAEVDIDGNTITINGRTYGHHNREGSVYPIKGDGFMPMDRAEYKVLGIYKTHGTTDLAEKILTNAGYTQAQKAKALEVLKWGEM